MATRSQSRARAHGHCRTKAAPNPGGVAGGKVLPLGNQNAAAFCLPYDGCWPVWLNRDGEERGGGDARAHGAAHAEAGTRLKGGVGSLRDGTRTRNKALAGLSAGLLLTKARLAFGYSLPLSLPLTSTTHSFATLSQ